MAMNFGGGGINQTDFTPRQVSLGQSGSGIPFVNTGGVIPGLGNSGGVQNLGGGPTQAPPGDDGPKPTGGDMPPAAQPFNPWDKILQTMPNVLTPESVRATGTGPFDNTYRQNLATFAGGQFMRPGGNLSFNPTDASTLPGNPTGGGNAPIMGMPNSLTGQALSGNPFSFTPPAPPAPAPQDDQFRNPLGWWRDQFLDNGNMMRGGFMPYM